jgi:hypothetical protein
MAALIRGSPALTEGAAKAAAEVRRDGREGGFIRARRFPVKPLVELPDKTREGGVGFPRAGIYQNIEEF